MNEEGFRDWLSNRGLESKSIDTQTLAVRRIEKILPELGVSAVDLDAAFDLDFLESTRSALEDLRQDAKQGGKKYRVLLPESEKPLPRLANYKQWLRNYRVFREGPNPDESQADKIREYVLQTYIVPARERGDDSVTVKIGDVNDAMSLGSNWANVYQALSKAKFLALADVPAPVQHGVDGSPATTLTFDLSAEPFTVELVVAELTRRFGAPINSTQKIVAFQLPDGRQVALDRDRPPAQIWVEANSVLPEGLEVRVYDPTESRHSNLPGRLKHVPAGGSDPRRVAMVRVNSVSNLETLLDWYATPWILNRDRLEILKQAFLAVYPDFEPAGFAARTGQYFTSERAYKDALLERAMAALQGLDNAQEAAFGARLLDILTGQGGVPSGLLGWRTDGKIKALRTKYPGKLEMEAGRLAVAADPSSAISAFVAEIWPMLAEGQSSKPYSESRNIPTMLAALAHPSKAYPINTDPLQRIARYLSGDQIMGLNPMTSEEYARVLALTEAIRDVMADDWGWAPRDLWDVQGFIWMLRDFSALEGVEKEGKVATMNSRPQPTNLILYGPPGTGKTYATAREAVFLCNGTVPDTREEVMTAYASLTARGRIEFVTFHQSYSYEEFVEGLRPEQQEGGAGFSLTPEMGVFRRIAKRAETSTGPRPDVFSVGSRQVFKMSIGEAGNPDDAPLFEEALAGGYALLGYIDVDLSAPQFEAREGIIEACRQKDPNEPVPDATNARVQCPFIFRNWARRGDVIVVSKGNRLFRAIGVVTGDYQYVPRGDGTYSHRRSVDWLWHDRAGVLVDEIYARGFSQKGIYLLDPEDLKITALEGYIASQDQRPGGAPEPFVLVIDEINRANISKVFGELITLLEADKRLGAENEIKVRLPYSREMFGVPANLHIVGTMNTADRSIALLDTALRRRFEFRELMPDEAALAGASAATGLNLQKVLVTINDRIEYLFDREHQIGHAYFINCTTKADVDSVMQSRVIPLLAEYFYDDWSKVAAVLGDSPENSAFLDCTPLKPPAGFEMEEGGEPRYRWRVRTSFGDNCYARFE